MRTSLAVVAMLILAGCPKPTEPEPVVVDTPAALTKMDRPEALELRPFQMPELETRELSNGIKVVVATNSEVPLWEVQVVFNTGTFGDPKGKEGLASVTFDMMNEGAGDKSAEDISRELKQLASSLGSYASLDGSTVYASGIKRNLEPTLDLLDMVVKDPTFPEEEWNILQRKRMANLKVTRENPRSLANRVFWKLLLGDLYRGRMTHEDTYAKLTVKDMKAYYGEWIGPQNAMILVGGDLTADEIMPLLEARLGQWERSKVRTPEPPKDLAPLHGNKLYVIDKPGASQSVLQVATLLNIDRNSDTYFDMYMANRVLGGIFSSRLNLNLREDKAYTYGARCGIVNGFGPSALRCSTSVQTDVTGPALVELRKELMEIRQQRPITSKELAYFQSNYVNSFPMSFETTDAILGAQEMIHRYGLAPDWTEQLVPNVQAVTVQGANTAIRTHWDPNNLVWLVVGDKEKILPGLQSFGLELVVIDTEGEPLQ